MENKKEIFTQFIKDNERKILLYIMLYIKNYHTALDLSQDTFYLAYKNLNKLKDIKKLKPWVYKIARNNALKELKFRKLIKNIPIINNLIKDKNDYIKSIEQRYDIFKALNKLKEEYKEIIVLSDIEGFSYKEIANILNINYENVRKRLSRAREKLRSILYEK